MDRTYTFYWLSGQREVLKGNDPADCMNKAGYGAGALPALDFYANGDDHSYEWKKRDGQHGRPNEWVRKELVSAQSVTPTIG